MLPIIYSQAYQELLKILLEWQNSLDGNNFNQVLLQNSFQEAKNFFQTQIINLSEESLDENIASRWRSLATEMHRSFKLLEMDMMFLRSAKQSTTQQQRLKSIDDRLSQIIGYCQVMLTEGVRSSEFGVRSSE
jgi:hypothetical protein